MQNKPIQKLYYSISDVSRMVDVKQHVLRYWENEFAELKPTKNRAGNRIYRLKEIKLIFLIKQLLYKEKYTIEGARRKLREILKSDSELTSVQVETPSEKLREMLQAVRNDIEDLNELLFHQSRGVAQSG